MKHIAVVVGNSDISCRPQGDYAAFIGDSKNSVVQRAIKARREWGETKYRILTGTLTQEVEIPVDFKLKKIKENKTKKFPKRSGRS